MNTKRLLSGAGGAAVTVGLIAAGAACAPLTVQAAVADGTLTVTGTAEGETIALRVKAGAPNTLQVDVGADGTAEFEFDRATFGQVQVLAGDGDDVISVDQANGAFADEVTTLDGGTGDDVIRGGDGNETLVGGIGNDHVDGNRGADRSDLGEGDDDFTWDPGDGNDAIEGQAGSDALVFNGANVDESMSLVAEGQRAVLVRNVGNIRMTTAGVETLDLAMLGGFDNLSVGADIGNTAMKLADVDMSAPGGGSDGSTDSVNLIGTPGTDNVTVDADGTAIAVGGLPLAANITGSRIPDQLQIAAEDADDTIVVDPAVDALITMLINIHV